MSKPEMEIEAPCVYLEGVYTPAEVVKSNVKRAEEAAVAAEKSAEMAEEAATHVNVFIPDVDAEGNLSWTNEKGLENPQPVNIKGPRGEKGDTGPEGPQGPKGDTGTRPQR